MPTSDASPSPDAPAGVDPGERSIECFKSGLNCAESVLRSLTEAYDLGLPPSAHGVATPFGGGFGGAKSACGALTGGLMALGLARGRQDPSQSPAPGSTAGRQLHDRFIDRFSCVDCKTLTSGFDWDQPERREACQAYVRFSAEVAASILDAPAA